MSRWPKTFSGRRASQDRGELKQFISTLRDEGVRRYCEIGAREGDTFVTIMESLPVGSYGVAVDLPGALWGKHTTRDGLERAVQYLRAQGYDASCLFGDSRSAGTRQQIMGRGPYDAMLIDGDHTYDGVRADWNAYRELASLVAFHDIVGVGEKERVHGNPVEVPRLWAEIKEEFARTREFVSDGSRMGIGVVWN